jgi:hypothetical protein
MRTLAFCVVVMLCSCLPAIADDCAQQTDFLTTPMRPVENRLEKLDATTPAVCHHDLESAHPTATNPLPAQLHAVAF